MKRVLIISLPVVIAVAAIEAMAQQPEQQAQAPAPRPRATFAERMKQQVRRVGGTVDQTKSTGDMVVSNVSDGKGGKLTIVIVNDARKSLVGFYIYNFGSLKNAANKEEVYKYLLLTNDAITIGSFFVDGEEDIGYKYLTSGVGSMSNVEFDQVYLTMAAVARERRAKIREMLGVARKDDSSSDGKKPGNSFEF
jgi:hypothetical protein